VELILCWYVVIEIVLSGVAASSLGDSRIDCQPCYWTLHLLRHPLLLAALNEADFKKMGRPCGKCLAVKGSRGTVTVKIVDICPSRYCKTGHVDLSSPALKKATGYSWDKKPVSFKVTSC